MLHRFEFIISRFVRGKTVIDFIAEILLFYLFIDKIDSTNSKIDHYRLLTMNVFIAFC